MSSPNPANLPLPLSPDPDQSPPSTLPLALPVPETHSPETEALIASLRTSLSSAQSQLSVQATRLSTLADVEAELSQLKDQYAFLTAAREAVETQLQEEVKKREVAEENVEMLRGQVEQARRGVMTLQKQDADRKRMSVIGGGVGAMGLGLGEEEILASLASVGEGHQRGESKIYKRQSMMAARSHRRVSSQSEPSVDIYSTATDRAITSSPNAQMSGNAATTSAAGTLRPNTVAGGLRELRLGTTPPTAVAPLALSPAATANNPHQSGYFDESLHAQPKVAQPESPSKNEAAAVAAAAKEEASQLRAELGTLQAKLEESEEARMASETCLKALREFMASNSASGEDNAEQGDGMTASTADLLKGIRLPPLPTDRDADEEHHDTSSTQPAKPSGWGFKLWANKAQPPTSPQKELPSTPGQQVLETLSNRSRAGSTISSMTPKVSPLPTPAEEGLTGQTLPTSLSTSTITTPLSSFVNNWTKGVSPGTPQAQASSSTALGLPPPNSRKLSVTNFFSRGGASAAAKEKKDKDLPTPPATIGEGGEKLEPSPEIEGAEEGEAERDDDRRKSHATTMTELEEELGTPQGSTKEVVDEGDAGMSNKERTSEKLDEIPI
ncbi:hypothetical protein CI109_102545 [Kwoniella shandongensis]|uniref:Uncharacterized protein n=1 Tax=Kwoniella shandongensis TaxID=1734106 RepID=A0A5M6BSP1_9TREE|nr:uncharacterized protein CI109_005840 [Kwoniella shandongensis]KAA5525817.1 hypothetical protein CI109_005840 [Kwoniella shandongensis]